jgi:AcrR family transcriptional regulator
MVGKRMPQAARREQLLGAAFAVACRDGVRNLTVRAVAAEARVSHGLVLFHFGRKDRLVRDLLGWLIEATAVLNVSDDIARFPRVVDRFDALLHQEMTRLSHQPEHIRLFLEYWAMGAQHAGIRRRISAELARYRAAFRTVLVGLPGGERAAASGITSEGLAAVAVSWIHGCAVQAMIDPEHFDTDAYLAALRGIVSQLV